MKRFLPLILITVILAQLLAPFSIGFGEKNKLTLINNKAEAGYLAVVTSPDGTQTKYLPQGTVAGASTNTTITECQDAIATFMNNPANNGWTLTTECKDSTASALTAAAQKPNTDTQTNLACDIWHINVGACIAQALYWIFFKPTSALFAIAGKMLDFTLMYTLSDSSYRSEFVTQGWGTIRDFCNMFFILVLLYIAVGTILDLHSVNTKKMLINVVIIGLLINFSLFATQLIIDASNILARVFYNPQTIVITQVDSTGKAIPGSNSGLGDFHEIRLSEAIVSKIDPQSIVDKASTTTDIPTKNIAGGGADSTSTAGGGMTVATFILIIFLCTAINIVGMIVFLSCALIFVGRVVMLWVAMIMAPLAFFSYIVPELQSVKMIGWKSWWSDLLKMSFVAPIFVFFMYIIVAFMDKGLSVVNLSVKLSMTGFSSLIAVMVPFLFIVVLLLQSKKIAVDMSGEMGAMVSKVGAAVGGFATGALVGAGAMAMRGTIGRAGNSIAENDKVNEAASKKGIKGWAARRLIDVGGGAGKATYDARNTKAMGAVSKATGANMGKAKEGGYAKGKADRVLKDQERAKRLEVKENSTKKQTLNSHEVALKQVQRRSAPALDEEDKKLEIARQQKNDTKVGSKENDEALEKIREANAEKTRINNGGERKDKAGNTEVDQDGNALYHTDNGKISEELVTQATAAEKIAGDNLKAASIALASVNKTDIAAYAAAQREFNKAQTESTAATKQKTHYEDEKNKVVSSGGKPGKSTKEINGNIKDSKIAIDKENTDRHFAEAERITTGWNKFARVLTGGSASGAEEAAQKIRMDTKIETKK